MGPKSLMVVYVDPQGLFWGLGFSLINGGGGSWKPLGICSTMSVW